MRLPIHLLPAYSTLRGLLVTRRGLRRFDPEHGAKLVERGYAVIREGRLFITHAGKQVLKQPDSS